MKIGLFSDTYPPEINGVATVTSMLARILKSHGHEVVVVTTGKKAMRKRYSIDGDVVRVNSKAFKHLYNYRMAWIYNRSAARYLRALDLDLIHVQTEIGIGLFGRLISKIYHIPLVYTYHTLYEDYTYYVTKGHQLFDRFAKHVVADLSRFCTDTSTEFTTTSPKTKDALRRYGATKYINIVPNGIDLDLFKPTPDEREKLLEYRRSHDLDGKFVLLILGRLAKEKSNDVVIDHLAAYIAEHGSGNLKMLVVGDGPDKADLEAQTARLGLGEIVSFVGSVPYEQVSFYYHLADLFVSASISETQGLTFIEAMASRLLVLARYDECLDGVIKDGESGYFFYDRQTFISKLFYLTELSASKLAEIKNRSYDLINNRYSLEAYYQAMINVYHRALRKYW